MGKLNSLNYLDYLNNFLNSSNNKQQVTINSLLVNSNGEYIASENVAYSPVIVNVPPEVEAIIIDENATYTDLNNDGNIIITNGEGGN